MDFIFYSDEKVANEKMDIYLCFALRGKFKCGMYFEYIAKSRKKLRKIIYWAFLNDNNTKLIKKYRM